jgi:hypothetical protein
MQPLTVTAIKDFSMSADGKQATFTLATKYAGDISVTLPSDCLKVFGAAAGAAETAVPSAAPVAAQPAPVKSNGGGNGSSAPAKPGEMQVVVPKKWGVGAETEKHGLVLIFIDPGAPNQSSFALEPKAAKEMAAALVTKADAVTERRASGPLPPSGGQRT